MLARDEVLELELRERICSEFTKARVHKGYSLKQMGDILGISYQRIGKFEKGISSPTLRFLVKYAKALDLTLDVILYGL